MHIDTAFPCSLQAAGFNYEGGWGLDFCESGWVQVLSTAPAYAEAFRTLDQTDELDGSVGWYC